MARPSPLISSPDSDSSPVQATPSVGAPCVVIGLAVLVDELGVALQQRLGGGDALDRGDLVGERRRDRVALQVDGVLAEGDRRADLEVDVLADLGEQVVERLAQAVGEDERADDERDADEDGDRDGDQPPDAGADALAGDERGGLGAHDVSSPRRFIWSSTCSAVGSAISSTIGRRRGRRRGRRTTPRPGRG